MKKEIKLLSLFSGMGGLDYGFESAGFSSCGCVENDNDACELLALNRPWLVFNNDIRKLNAKDVRKKASLKIGELDLLIGGPPCQSYSKSSFWNEDLKRGYDDSRGKLIDHYLRFVEELLPKVFFIENVPGFCYSGQSDGLKKVFKVIEKISKEKGIQYLVTFKVLNCVQYGVPQKRERFFLVANRLGVNFQFPKETHDHPDSKSVLLGEKLPYTTAQEAFFKIPENKISSNLDIGGKWAELIPYVPPGTNYQYFTEKGKGPAIFKYRSRYWTFLLKLSPREPSWTIQASPGSSTGPFHWENRKLSARELARLQTIPDNISLLTNRTTMQRLIGNAVPSLMGEIFGKEFKKQFFKKEVFPHCSLLPKKTNLQRAVVLPKVPRNVPSIYLGK